MAEQLDGLNPPKGPTARENDNEVVLNVGAQSLIAGQQVGDGFNIYRYPSELATDNHPHYVMFYIVERASEVKSEEVATLRDDKGKRISYDYSKNNTGVSKTAAGSAALGTAAGAVAGTALASTGADLATDAGLIRAGAAGTTARIATTIGGGVVGGVAGASAGLTSQATQVMLKDAIALYMSGTPSAKYSAAWETEELGLVGGASMQAQSMLTNGITGFFKGAGAGLFEAPDAFILKAADKNNDLFGNTGAAFSAAAGKAVNPFEAQIFRNMGFRKFSFDYVFLPKNEAEYRQVQTIIYTFKKYMHPLLGSGKFVMGYPAEFIIAYYHKETLNTELFRMSNSALTGLEVNYGAAGDFVTFKKLPQAPIEITLKLDFTELEILSRERIQAGF